VVGRYGETLEVAYENLEGKNFEIGFLNFVFFKISPKKGLAFRKVIA